MSEENPAIGRQVVDAIASGVGRSLSIGIDAEDARSKMASGDNVAGGQRPETEDGNVSGVHNVLLSFRPRSALDTILPRPCAPGAPN